MADETEKPVDKRIGNQFWLARSSHGRKPKFESAEALQNAAHEYFQWVEDNPLWESKVTQFQGAPIDMVIPKMRAMTLDGLHLFLDITDQTWINYRNKKDFLEVVAKIDKAIRSQKFSGAAADLLNANIIARDLGLTDKQEVTEKKGLEAYTDEELRAKLNELENE